MYIGARPGRVLGLPELIEAGHKITILEIWPDNVDYCREHLDVERVIGGNVLDVDKLLPVYHFDVAFWYHGPEHVLKEEWADTFVKLEALADLVILGGPNGKTSQGIIYNNLYEVHVSALSLDGFESLGYETNTWNGEILAWKDNRA